MSAQKGKDLLLKILNNTGESEKTYTTVMGLRAQTITMNSAVVDTSDASQTHGWRELLGGAGLKTMSITGEGIFRDSGADEKIRKAFIESTTGEWQIHIPDFYDITGAFQITLLEYAGEYDNTITWRVTLESAGALDWTEVANV